MNLSTYLLGIILIIFLFQITVADVTPLLIFVPSLAWVEPWRFISSIFLHGGVTHLFFNGYALFLFGTILENKVSKKDFLTIFFVSGIIGSLFYLGTIYTGISPDIPALGASGAIYGLLGAVAVFLPDLRIFFFFFPMRMREAALLWVAIAFIGSFNSGSLIGHSAHLGGLLFGAVYAYYLKNKEHQVDPIYLAYYK